MDPQRIKDLSPIERIGMVDEVMAAFAVDYSVEAITHLKGAVLQIADKLDDPAMALVIAERGDKKRNDELSEPHAYKWL